MKKSFEVSYLQTKHIAVNKNKVSCVKFYINCLVDLSVNLKLIILERLEQLTLLCIALYQVTWFGKYKTLPISYGTVPSKPVYKQKSVLYGAWLFIQ